MMTENTFESVAAAVDMRWGIKIPLRDGIRLDATLYLPRDQTEPSPALLTITPYIAQTYHDVGVYFASQGYPFLTIDVRGRGNSEGVFQPFVNEARDAFDVVEWLAQQPYCSGQVAMWGGSYAAYNQWAAASELPPHLSTIVPAASPFLGVDFPIRNNIAAPYLIQWLTLVSGRTSQDRMFWNNELFWGMKFREWFESGVPFKELDSKVGNPSAIFQEWISHPLQDEHWDSLNPTADDYERIKFPVLTITGACDDDQPGALMHYRRHLECGGDAAGSRHYLVIGPWDHAGTRNPQTEFLGLKVGPASLLDLRQLHLAWYSWIMRGGSKPPFLKKNVAYYVMGLEKWRYADSLEDITSHSIKLYLHSTGNPTDIFKSGSLVVDGAQESGPDQYVYDPCDVRLAALESAVDPESRVDQQMLHAGPGRQLIYHSAPFDSDLEISGFFRLSAWISIDQPDTDFRVSVYEIDLNGRSVLLSSDQIRARYRETLREAKLIRTDYALLYDFDRFTFVSRLVSRGHRLRLVIGPINSIYSQRNSNGGGVVAEETMKDGGPVRVLLFHNGTCPSVLHVPVGRSDL